MFQPDTYYKFVKLATHKEQWLPLWEPLSRCEDRLMVRITWLDLPVVHEIDWLGNREAHPDTQKGPNTTRIKPTTFLFWGRSAHLSDSMLSSTVTAVWIWSVFMVTPAFTPQQILESDNKPSRNFHLIVGAYSNIIAPETPASPPGLLSQNKHWNFSSHCITSIKIFSLPFELTTCHVDKCWFDIFVWPNEHFVYDHKKGEETQTFYF